MGVCGGGVGLMLACDLAAISREPLDLELELTKHRVHLAAAAAAAAAAAGRAFAMGCGGVVGRQHRWGDRRGGAAGA